MKKKKERPTHTHTQEELTASFACFCLCLKMEVRAVYFPYLCFRREICFIYVIKMDARFGFLKLNGNLVFENVKFGL